MKEISSISDGPGAGAPASDDPDRTGFPRSLDAVDGSAPIDGLTLGRWFFLWMLLVALLALGTTVAVVLAAQAGDLTDRLEQRARSAIRAATAHSWDDQSGSLLITALPEMLAAEVRLRDGALIWQYGPFDEIRDDPSPRAIVVSDARILSGTDPRTLDVTLVLSTTLIRRQGLKTGARLILSLGLVLALGMVGGMIMINRVVEPLRAVADSVAAFDPGIPVQLPEGRGGGREIVMLAAAFRSMAARLVAGRRALARSEQRFRGLFESSPVALLEVDAGGRIVGANPASRSLIGRAPGPAVEPLRLDRFLDRGTDLAAQAVEHDRAFAVEADWTTASGEVLEVELHFQRVGGEGPPVSLLAVRDLSDRLRRLGERWQRTLDEMDEGVALLTEAGLPVQTNRSFDAFGEAVLSRVAEHPETNRREWRQQVGDRSLRCVAAPVSEAGERLLVVRDETEWIRAEEQVREGRTMEAVATLAGGVAHDFNNLLAGILLHLRVLEKGADSEGEAVRTIRELAEEGADVVKGLVDFANPDRGPKEAVDLVPLVEEQIRLLRRLLPEGLELIDAIEADRAVMAARAGDLRRILVNLVLNARDAFGNRPGSIEVRLTENGREAIMMVTDTGPGIPLGIRDRIFEPFFSLRREGRGSGLGLAVTYALVEEHEGSIVHEDPPGGGARFVIRFPLQNAATDGSSDDPGQGLPEN